MTDSLPEDTPYGEMIAHYALGMCDDWAGHPAYVGDEHAGLRQFLSQCADGLRWQRDEIERLRRDLAAAYCAGAEAMREACAEEVDRHCKCRVRKDVLAAMEHDGTPNQYWICPISPHCYAAMAYNLRDLPLPTMPAEGNSGAKR
jgi:hypothetical protein